VGQPFLAAFTTIDRARCVHFVLSIRSDLLIRLELESVPYCVPLAVLRKEAD
jgi:hypothetical protein